MSDPIRRAIPTPTNNVDSLLRTVKALTEQVNILTAQAGDGMSSGVTLGQLVDLGLITKDQARSVGARV